MAKTKAELLEEAKNLGIEVDSKAKVADIQAAIDSHATVTAEVASVEVEAPKEDAPVAKAGKRSAKALAEAEEKQAKEDRKESGEEEAEKPKAAVTPTRSRLERRAKGYRKSFERIEKDKTYSLDEAIKLAKATSHVKFDASVEIHINLGVDPRQADQNIRDSIVLPSGTGKDVRVAVADEDLLAKLDKGTIDFDVLVARPDFMPRLGKYARLLGPRGLMPNPKSGTVTTDVDRAVAEAKAGRVEYRVDSTGIVHLSIGKVSFEPAKLQDNAQPVLASLRSNKPGSIKGTYMRGIHLSTSMGPSIKVEVNNA